MANGPEPAALEFLEKIREGSLDLEPGGDTALQPTTSEKKRRQIRQDLERLEKDLRGGELELGDVNQDGNFAAVMVLKAGGFDSAQAQVFPVALVRRGDDWLPAPVLASFENAVAAYTLPIKKRLFDLEAWMLHKRVTDLGQLIDESAGRMRNSIAKSVSEEFLKTAQPGEIAERFLEACSEGNAPAILGFLGGLSEPLPVDWEIRMNASQAAATGAENPDSPWHLLSSPRVVRVKVLEDLNGDSALLSFGCLDPRQAGSRGTLGIINIVHLPISRDSGGRWRINPSDALLNDDAEAFSDDSDLDVDLLDGFPKVFRESTPLVGKKTLGDAENAVLEVLRGGDLADLLSFVDFGKRGKDGRIACAEAANLWWSVNAPGQFRVPVRLDSKEEGTLRVVTYQWFSVSHPDRYELQTLYFKKQAEGWVWAPGVVPTAERKDQQVLSEWVKAGEADWRISWRARLMEGSSRLKNVNGEDPPTDIEAQQAVKEWMAALENKQMKRALELSAWFGEEGELPIKALRNLCYEFTAKAAEVKTMGKIYRGDRWVAVRITKSTDEDAKEAQLKDVFVVVVMTESGAKVVPELDLLGDDSRTRSFLNKETFKRLEERVGEAPAGELQALFESFLGEIKPN
ncbi:MAG: hypothetical protein NWT08_08370 [Akkermansiaceae bacterium]|nr:hypothetical protein [Akkermansiaceae bacterium]MDP4647959.1 hypothetical protein [Akkermansiaceae bacterium]MDP4719749.1 hypothetical protein [Akkermansiaceae bacterium]MDP4781304.1 hypothetical protein [Akkermansiaceae bacterium]MDP4897553.1 hypothetical protein [Akkermansiaceae bacterium]